MKWKRITIIVDAPYRTSRPKPSHDTMVVDDLVTEVLKWQNEKCPRAAVQIKRGK